MADDDIQKDNARTQPDDTKTDDVEERLRWKIDKDIELYKFYLEVSVKACVFLMAITGAIASYVLSNNTNPLISIGLAFPALVNGGFAIFFCFSIVEARRIARSYEASCKKLGVEPFDMGPLFAVALIFCLMCGLATVGLLRLMLFQLLGR
ncbi:hypothetical protein E1N52_33655 [Paraburkholderia guartelaensis]|uniref:Uncharacterized protein n=1 Tax=Paraburkholderia guartelaensis TaxID=2546446 RepID=A0A4R5L7A5_9BURK|nr:hypothetical protein [Paraburkholderia guartelaensis]TDG03575.1 hypothetical protein E1N52_33655 [Paraburkholderia guartelaensis]